MLNSAMRQISEQKPPATANGAGGVHEGSGMDLGGGLGSFAAVSESSQRVFCVVVLRFDF